MRLGQYAFVVALSAARMVHGASPKGDRSISASPSALGVRRDKAALSSGCESHPATAPAGSNRSNYGGNEMVEAFGKRVTNWWPRECAGRNASER